MFDRVSAYTGASHIRYGIAAPSSFACGSLGDRSTSKHRSFSLVGSSCSLAVRRTSKLRVLFTRGLPHFRASRVVLQGTAARPRFACHSLGDHRTSKLRVLFAKGSPHVKTSRVVH